MKNRWILVLSFVAVFVAVFVAGGALGVAADRFYIGVVPSGRVTEQFQMTTGVSPTGNDLRPKWVSQDREVVNVPSHYGRVVAVNSGRETSVIWYEDKSGRLRNVVLEQPDATWYVIEQKTSTDMKITRRAK